MSESGQPLVSICVPTYERAAMLPRALESALAQTHSPIEVVISDNASRDRTEAICREVAERDSRVRYLRQRQNAGPTANFNRLFEACQGEYVLMLADDDWLDPDYVSSCLSAIRADPQTALVAGRARYVRAGAFVQDGVVHRHCQPDPGARVRAYLEAVDDNGVFYGLMPRAVLERVRPLPNVLGNDWLHVARIAFQGDIRTVEEVCIHRELEGTSANVASILSTFDRAGWQARVPQLVIAWHLLRDIGWVHPVYEPLGRAPRLILAVRAAIGSIRWRHLAWHLVTPTIASLGERPRGRPLLRLYLRLTRALGAGRQG